MTLEFYRTHCLAKPGVTEDTPFDANTLCFRVGGKIFSLLDIEAFDYINLKCDPERAIELREQYDGITPGYHMNKQHWNTIICDGSASKKTIFSWIDDSYNLVASSLTKKLKSELDSL